MPATVTNLQAWKAAHPPILTLWDAQCRAWWNWYSLPFIMAARNARNLQNGVLFGGRFPK